MPILWNTVQTVNTGKRNRKFVTVICSVCNNKRLVSVDNAKKLKSDTCKRCSSINRRPYKQRIKKVCIVCKNEFYVLPSNKGRTFCSSKCYHTKIEKNCIQCGVRFVVCRSQINRKFCSSKCYGTFQKTKITKTCPTCGKQFSTIPSINAIHCSGECYIIEGKNNPNYIHGKYIGGHVGHPYGGSWESIRKSIKERDNYQCQYPGCNSSDNLQVHHIIRPEDCKSIDEANAPNNLITYCRKHHQLIHYG